MTIDYNILIAYGGFVRKFEKGEIVFHEGTDPFFFYQVVEGGIKVFSSSKEGKELIQGIFKEGESFGEPPLLLGKKYPSTAQAIIPSVVIKIPREKLMYIFKDYPELAVNLLFNFAERIYYKATSAQIWISQTPEQKITHFLNRLKGNVKSMEKTLVPHTRQQIADCTGLRVETVIRTLGQMSREGKVNIVDRKVYC